MIFSLFHSIVLINFLICILLKVSEAIKVGAQAIKEKRISLDEIEQCLQDFDVAFSSLKLVDEVLGNSGISMHSLINNVLLIWIV